MKIRNVKYDELQEYLDNVDEHGEDPDFEEETIVNTTEFAEGDFILLIGPAVRVPDKNLIFASGLFYDYNEAEGKAEADWDIVLIYENVEDDEGFDPERYLYFEQGLPTSAIHNFEHYRKVSK